MGHHVTRSGLPKTHGEGVVGADEVVAVVGLVDGLQAAALHAQAQAVQHISAPHTSVGEAHAVGGAAVVGGDLQGHQGVQE